MPSDRLHITVQTQGNDTTRVVAHRAAPNLATHHPINPELRGMWVDVTQISTGLRAGRFLCIDDARAFAVQAADAVPALATGGVLSDAAVETLAALRKRHNGRRH